MSSSSRPSPPSPSRLERLREELAWLRERCSVSAAVRGRSARRKVTLPGKPSLEGCLRELSEAQRGWEALLASAASLRRGPGGGGSLAGVDKAPWKPGWEALAAAAEGTAALPENSQETLLNFLDLGLALIRCIQASRAGRGRGGGGGRGRPRASQGPPSPAPWGPQSSTGGPEGEEASSLDLLLEKVEAWQKEVDALKGTRGGAKHVYGKKKRALASLGHPLPPILDLEEGLDATPQKAEGLQWKLGVLANLEPPVTSILDSEEEEEATFTAPHNSATPQKVEDLHKKLGVLANLEPPVTSILDAEEEEEATLYDLWDGANPEKVMDPQGNWGDLATQDMSSIEDPEDEEKEITLDALLEKTDALQKEVGALKDGVTLRGKVKDLQGKRGVLALELRDFIAKEIWALEQEAEALWDAWFLKALRNIPPENLGCLQEKVGILNNALREFVADTPMQKKMSALEKMEALRDALQESGSALRHAPLERDALWEKVTELNFALWEIQLDRMVALLGVVDTCWDALRKAPQNGLGALLKKLKAMQGILRAAPLKELSSLHKITSGLLDAMVDFPRDAPAKEKQDALWDALQDVPLKEMGGLWRKVRTLWGIPLKLFAVWEKVYNLKVFLWDDSQNRVCNLQENVEALKDALRDALWEKMGAEQDKLSTLWASVQSFPLSKLVALQDKLNALEERLLNVLEEKHPPLKETASASQKVLDSLHSVSQGELSEIPEEEVDAQQRTPAEEEEITEADKTDSLPAWKTPDSGVSQRNPGKAHLLQPLLQPWTALQMNHPIPVKNVTSFSMQEQVPNPAFPNTVALPGLQNGQPCCALETQPSLLQPVLSLSATAGVLSNQHETPSGMTPPQPAVPLQPPTRTSSFAIPSTPVADSPPDVDQIQSTPTVGHTTDSNAVLNHSAASNAREGSILKAILTTNYISPEPWQFSRGTLSTTQQGDFSKTEQMINLSVDHNISVTSSQPDDHGCSKGQNTEETEKLISEDVLEAPLASSEQTAPELANSEPPLKKQKTDHNSQGPTLDHEMVKEYRKYRKCVLAILNQYKSRVDKLRTKLKQSLNQTCAFKDTEEIKALTSTLKREQAVLKQFDCFRDVHKSKDDP